MAVCGSYFITTYIESSYRKIKRRKETKKKKEKKEKKRKIIMILTEKNA